MINLVEDLIKFQNEFQLLQHEFQLLQQKNRCLQQEIEHLKSFKISIPSSLSEEDYLISVTEAAIRLKTNRNYIYKLISKGHINALKLGSLKIRNTEINRFLTENEGKDLTDLSNIKEL